MKLFACQALKSMQQIALACVELSFIGLHKAAVQASTTAAIEQCLPINQ